jgi:hypothetical protein
MRVAQVECYALLATIGSGIEEVGIIRKLKRDIFVVRKPHRVASARLLYLDNFSSHIRKDSGASGASMEDSPFQDSYTFKRFSHSRNYLQSRVSVILALDLVRTQHTFLL